MIGAGRRRFSMILVGLMLAISMAACSLNSPEMLNDGQGTREDPVPAQKYAKTTEYDVRALSVVWPQNEETQNGDEQFKPIRVQYQIRCTKSEDDVCRLENIGRSIKLVDVSGILYDPVYSYDVEKPLEGEILGDAEQAGWLAYEVPQGIEVAAAVSEYSDDQRVFFTLP